jgi:hypothetical protein
MYEPTDTGKTNSYGYKMADCQTFHPDDPDKTLYPVTLDGVPLDEWCNHVDTILDQILYPLTDLAANHPTGLAFNPEAIPSQSQRRAFMLMRALLENARSLAGTLRYDVSVEHDNCIMHDEHVNRNVARIIETIGNFNKETA